MGTNGREHHQRSPLSKRTSTQTCPSSATRTSTCANPSSATRTSTCASPSSATRTSTCTSPSSATRTSSCASPSSTTRTSPSTCPTFTRTTIYTCPDFISESRSEGRRQLAPSDTFIVIDSLERDRTFKTVSPFIIEKSLSGTVGTIKSAKKLKDGRLLVEILRPKQAENLKKLDTFCGLKVKVYAHSTLNSSKGIIRDRRLFCCSDDEIQSELANQGVTHIRRIKIKKGKDLKPTNTFIITFNTPQLPKTLKIFYQIIPVDIYIPNPLRCFNCQKFGHHDNHCSNIVVCRNCAGVGNHHEDSCDKPSKCANCSGDHPANSNKCPVWVKEKEITRIKFTNNISYPEARKQFERIPAQTYSHVVKSGAPSITVRDVTTQTSDASTQTTDLLSTTPVHTSTVAVRDTSLSNAATTANTFSGSTAARVTPVTTAAVSPVHKGKPLSNKGKTAAGKETGSTGARDTLITRASVSPVQKGKPLPETGKNKSTSSSVSATVTKGLPDTGKNSKVGSPINAQAKAGRPVLESGKHLREPTVTAKDSAFKGKGSASKRQKESFQQSVKNAGKPLKVNKKGTTKDPSANQSAGVSRMTRRDPSSNQFAVLSTLTPDRMDRDHNLIDYKSRSRSRSPILPP